MRINLRSNFVLPGLEGRESVDLDESSEKVPRAPERRASKVLECGFL
jgi:hypothetical protein